MDESEKREFLDIILSRETHNQIYNLRQILNICESLQYRRYFEKPTFNSQILQDNNLLYQKCHLHGCSIHALSTGIKITNTDLGINQIINDPFSINVIFRTLLETFLTFYFVNFSPTDEENQARHLIWIIFGLYQRQKIKIADVSNPLLKMNETKLREEKQNIEKLLLILYKYESYKNLSHDKKVTLNKTLKSEWKIIFSGESFRTTNFPQILDLVGIRMEIYSNIYNNLSWSAHSTSISISQFKDLWNNERNDILIQNNTLMHTSSFLSFMTADLIRKDHEYYSSYLQLSQYQKDLLNFYNYYFRGNDKTIERIN